MVYEVIRSQFMMIGFEVGQLPRILIHYSKIVYTDSTQSFIETHNILCTHFDFYFIGTKPRKGFQKGRCINC